MNEALDEYYARLKRIEKIREPEEQVCGKTLNAPVDEILHEIEEKRKHRQGHEQHPVTADEFSLWETEQVWGEE